jgi:hypothetical protein
MGIDYIGIIVNCILMGVCATTFFKAAEMEHKSPWVWTGISLAIFLTTAFAMHWGWAASLCCQVAVFAVITFIRVLE